MSFFYCSIPFLLVYQYLERVINYEEGVATKWGNRGSETFCASPSRDRVTLFAAPHL